jgi:hypothetical protein
MRNDCRDDQRGAPDVDGGGRQRGGVARRQPRHRRPGQQHLEQRQRDPAAGVQRQRGEAAGQRRRDQHGRQRHVAQHVGDGGHGQHGAGDPGDQLPAAGLQAMLAGVSVGAGAAARAQHMPGQRRHHQQAERQQQQPVQQRAADQQGHHHVQQVVQGAEVTPRADQAQQVPLQQAQHRNPGEQIDQLLPQVRPLQPVQNRTGGHQQQPGRPRPRQRLQSVLAQLSGGEQRPRAPAQPEHQRQRRHGQDAERRQQPGARGVVVAGEGGLDRQAARQPDQRRLGLLRFVHRLPQRRRVHRHQPPVELGHLLDDLGHAPLHLRRQRAAAAAEVDQPGQRLGQQRLRAFDLGDHLPRSLPQRRRQVGLPAGGQPRGAARRQLGGVLRGDVGRPRELGAGLRELAFVQQPVPLQALQPLHRVKRQVAALGERGQPVDRLGLLRQRPLDAQQLVGSLRASLHRLDELLLGVGARRDVGRRDRLAALGRRLGARARRPRGGRQQAEQRQQQPQPDRADAAAGGRHPWRRPPAGRVDSARRTHLPVTVALSTTRSSTYTDDGRPAGAGLRS